MSGLSFLNQYKKVTGKMEGVTNESHPPEFFFDTGSAIINKIISGRYKGGGYPEGRMTMIAGPANAGKSFLVGNAIRTTLANGGGVLAIDSENALDSVYLSNLGVDTNDPRFVYNGITSIPDTKTALSEFFKLYKSAPESERIPFLITIDSLDELRSTTQVAKDEKGELHKDMGLRVKEVAEIQSMIMHNIANLRMACIATKQPYQNQDTYTQKQEPWVITQKLKFAYTQILFVTNTMKKGSTGNYDSINLTVFGRKTRLTKPFQKCVIEVPYETGMDWYSGILEASESLGVVTRNGSWYNFNGNKFQKGNFADHRDAIFEALLEVEGEVLSYEDSEEDDAK